jgi:hypothetical protein
VKYEIEINDAKVAAGIKQAIEAEMEFDAWGHPRGDVARAIARQAAELFAARDFRPEIEAAAREVMPPIVRKIAEAELRRKLKATAREMAKSGELFAEQEG